MKRSIFFAWGRGIAYLSFFPLEMRYYIRIFLLLTIGLTVLHVIYGYLSQLTKIRNNLTEMEKQKYDPILVYCNWANTFNYQSYIWKSIYQARLTNPKIPIVVITTAEAIASISTETMSQFVVPLKVKLEDFTDDYKNSSLLKQFEKVFFIHEDMKPIDGNPSFVMGSIIRMLLIHEWISREKAKNVFHLENDNTLYRDLANLTKTIKDTCKGASK